MFWFGFLEQEIQLFGLFFVFATSRTLKATYSFLCMILHRAMINELFFFIKHFII